MTDPLFRIKPLVWKDDTTDQTSIADQALFNRFYWIDRDPSHGLWRWGLYTPSDVKISSGFGLRSMESAKAAAEAHNREMMMLGLEEVE